MGVAVAPVKAVLAAVLVLPTPVAPLPARGGGGGGPPRRRAAVPAVELPTPPIDRDFAAVAAGGAIFIWEK